MKLFARSVVSAGLVVSCGCASVTPAHRLSGYRPDKAAYGERIPERVRVRVLTAAEVAKLKGPLGYQESAAIAVAAEAAAIGIQLGAKAFRKSVEKGAALHTSSYSGSIWETHFYKGDGNSNEINL